MSLPNDLRMRQADLDDLPRIAALRESVGWSVNEWALRAVIGRPQAHCVVVDDGESVIGVGSGISYGLLGFVGNMVVAEAQRRRGVGSTILEVITSWLAEAGCRRLELNATSEGRPLYERHGFESIGMSSAARIGRDRSLSTNGSVTVRRAEPGDLEALSTYDLPRFGGDRRGLLEFLVADPGAPFLLAERSGAMVGYACVRPDTPRIGPLLADDPSVAETLVLQAFGLVPATDELRLNLPPNNHPGAEWLHRLGVSIEPWDGRMARGQQLPRREETIYGMTVGALG